MRPAGARPGAGSRGPVRRAASLTVLALLFATQARAGGLDALFERVCVAADGAAPAAIAAATVEGFEPASTSDPRLAGALGGQTRVDALLVRRSGRGAPLLVLAHEPAPGETGLEAKLCGLIAGSSRARSPIDAAALFQGAAPYAAGGPGDGVRIVAFDGAGADRRPVDVSSPDAMHAALASGRFRAVIAIDRGRRLTALLFLRVPPSGGP